MSDVMEIVTPLVTLVAGAGVGYGVDRLKLRDERKSLANAKREQRREAMLTAAQALVYALNADPHDLAPGLATPARSELDRAKKLVVGATSAVSAANDTEFVASAGALEKAGVDENPTAAERALE